MSFHCKEICVSGKVGSLYLSVSLWQSQFTPFPDIIINITFFHSQKCLVLKKFIWSPYILISWGWLWAVPKIWHWRINPCCGNFRIQGTQKYERTPRSNSILVNYLCYLSINLFIYYMQTILTVRVGKKCSLTYHSEMILPLSTLFLYTLGGKWPIWWSRVWQIHWYFFLMGSLQYLEDKK